MLTVVLGVVTFLTAGTVTLVHRSIHPDVEERWKMTITRLCFGGGYLLAFIGSKLGFGELIPLVRYFLNGMMGFFCPKVSSEQVQREEGVFDGVRVRIYRPMKRGDAARAGLVFFHGGGWVMCSIDSHDGLAAYFALNADIVVASVEYRLAPEHPFPTPLDDCRTAAQYFIRNAAKFGVDANRVAIGGDSSGGNLAAAVCLQLREINVQPLPKAQVLIYPVLQVVDFATPSYFRLRRYANPRMFAWSSKMYLNLAEEYMEIMGKNEQMSPTVWKKIAPYMNVELLPKEHVPHDFKQRDPNNYDSRVTESLEQKLIDPHVSPLLADDVTDLPTTFVFTAGTDPLRDDGAFYAQRLKKAGVKVTWLDLPGGSHGCLSTTRSFLRVKSGQKALDAVVKFLMETL